LQCSVHLSAKLAAAWMPANSGKTMVDVHKSASTFTWINEYTKGSSEQIYMMECIKPVGHENISCFALSIIYMYIITNVDLSKFLTVN